MTKEFTMTIEELKKLLDEYNDNAEIVFGRNNKENYIGIAFDDDYEEIKKF